MLVLPPFSFRIEPEHVAAYREALGEPGDRVPFAMALRALASEEVTAALTDMAQGKLCIHLGQDVTAGSDLRAGIAYRCELRVIRQSANELRIEQRLRLESGETAAAFMSGIRLVAG